MNRRALEVALGWSLVTAIVVLSLAPFPSSSPDVPYHDKWGHLLAYGVLMGWFAHLYPRPAVAWRYCAGFAALGILLEFVQTALPYRDGDPIDGWANLIGLALGMAIGRALAGVRNPKTGS